MKDTIGPDEQAIIELEDIPDVGLFYMPIFMAKVETILRNKSGVDFFVTQGEQAFFIRWDDERQDVVVDVYVFNGSVQINRFVTPRILIREAIEEHRTESDEPPTVADITSRRPVLIQMPVDITAILNTISADDESCRCTEEN